MLEDWRKGIDRHNAWQQEHPGTSKRSKVPPGSSQLAYAGRAMFFAALLTGDHISKVQAAVASSSGSSARGRTHHYTNEGASSSAQGPKDPAQSKAEKDDCHALERQAVTTGFTGPTESSKELHATAFEPKGTSTSMLRSKRFDVDFEIFQPSTVSTHRVWNADTPPVKLQSPSLKGDLPIDPDGLIGARVRAMRELLGAVAEGKEDEQLLELANSIHRSAHLVEPMNSTAVDLSLALFNEEMAIWARAQGDGKHISEHIRIEAFREAWSFALNPPPSPEFKSQTELAQSYITENKIEQIDDPDIKALQTFDVPELGLIRTLKGIVISDADLLSMLARTPNIKIKYFKQFDQYIRSHLEAAVNAKILSNLDDAKIGRLTIEYRPENAWAIRDVRVKWRHGPYRGEVPYSASLSPREPAMLVPAPDGRHLLISPDGSLKYVNDAFKNGKIHKEAILDALGIKVFLDKNEKKEKSGTTTSVHDISLRAVYVRNTPHRLFTIRKIMQGKIAHHILSLIETWKEREYEPDAGERLLNFVVPFYEIINRAQLDSEYKIKASDIAIDVISLGFTLASIGGSTLSLKGVMAGISAARTAKAATASARASNFLRAVFSDFKTSSFLKKTGKELTDFVMPIFTAGGLMRTASRLPKLVLSRKVGFELAQMDSAIVRIATGKDRSINLVKRLFTKASTSSFTVDDAATLVSRNPASLFIDEKRGFAYHGVVFRGDMRAPDVIFSQGFKLRSRVEDLTEVNGFRGGFGGGKNALDMDGKGISTSPYMKIDGAGADVYGRDRGGYTYVIDATNLEGYDLYRNDHFAKAHNGYKQRKMLHALDKARKEAMFAFPRSLEINYGTDIPVKNILGAFDKSGNYVPNLSLANKLVDHIQPTHRLRAIADRLRTAGDWDGAFGDIAPMAAASALGRQIVIHGHPAHASPLVILPRGLESGPPIHVIYRPGHYQALVNGRAYEVPGDGDCFFRAVLMGVQDIRHASDVAPQAVRHLREQTAQEVLRYPADYEPFLIIS